MEIYRDFPLVYRAKEYHATKKKNKRAFGIFFGDIPVAYFNSVTKKWEECVNTRGNAYATRRRAKFRRNKKKGIFFMNDLSEYSDEYLKREWTRLEIIKKDVLDSLGEVKTELFRRSINKKDVSDEC